jgi:hypothetical protein
MLQQHTALRAASPDAHPDRRPRNNLRGIACPSLTVLECLSTYRSPQHQIPTACSSLRHNCPWTEVCRNPCNLTCLRTHLYPPPCPTHTELRCVRTVHLSPLRPWQQMRGLRLFTAHTELCDALHHQRCVRIPCSQRTRPLRRMHPCKSRARPWLSSHGRYNVMWRGLTSRAHFIVPVRFPSLDHITLCTLAAPAAAFVADDRHVSNRVRLFRIILLRPRIIF